jgi:hypothetical protein
LTAAAARYEEILEREGLAPLDAPGGQVSGRDTYALRDADDAVAARDMYLTWAREVLGNEACFRGQRSQRSDASVGLRDVWELHADGKSNGEIARALKVSREVVKKAIRRVTKRAPPAPVLNPWLKSGRDEALYERANPRALARICKLAIEVAGIDQVLEAIGNDRKLLRLLPRERTAIMAGTDGTEKKGAGAAPRVRYAFIKLNTPIQTPGNPVRKNMLLDMEGRPHAGGIDVVFPEAKAIEGTDKKLDVVKTVPWHKIDDAERVVGE